MARRVDKGRRNYTYSGDPKSYWGFAETTDPAAPSSNELMVKARAERLKKLDDYFAEVQRQRDQARKNIGGLK